MKNKAILIGLSVLLLTGSMAFAMKHGSAKKGDDYYKCMCNINRCLNTIDEDCLRVVKCDEISAGEFEATVANRQALYVINSHLVKQDGSHFYCIDYRRGLPRQ